MSELVVRNYEGNVIHQRLTDRYFDATGMCRATGKLWADYWRLNATQEFVAVLSGSMGIPIDLLVQSVVVGPNEHRGTWVHPRIAINLAQWASPKFAVMVSGWVEELLTTGSVSLKPTTLGQQLLAQAQALVALEEQQSQLLAATTAANHWATQAHATARAAFDVHTSNYGHYTVLGYCSLHGIPCDQRSAAAHGRSLSRLCRDRGITLPTQMRDSRWGSVNQYPEGLLNEYFGSEVAA